MQFYPIFALFSTSGGMNLDHDFAQMSKLSEDQKEVFIKMGNVFPNSGEDQKKGFHQKLNTFFPQIQVRTKKKSSPKMEHLFSPNLGEDQKKKRSSPNLEIFFPEFKWTPTLRCAPESNCWGGDADVDHTQTIGGDTDKLLGGYIPPSSSVRRILKPESSENVRRAKV